MFSQQTTLNEITNKVFNELLQQKVEAHAKSVQQQQQQQQNQSNNLLPPTIPPSLIRQKSKSSDAEDGGTRSDDWCSETSSSQLRQTASKTRINAMNRHRRHAIMPMPAKSTSTSAINERSEDENCNKKPLIAVWKAGVKVQNTSTVSSSTDNNGL